MTLTLDTYVTADAELRLYHSALLTFTGLSLDSGKTYAVSLSERDDQEAVVTASGAAVDGEGDATITLELATEELEALFTGHYRRSLVLQLHETTSSPAKVVHSVRVPVYWAPDLEAVVTTALGDEYLAMLTALNAAAVLDSDFTANGRMVRTAAGTYTTILDKLDGTAAPGVGDDSADGYSVGSFWCDVTNDKGYVCLDATEGAAVWREFTSGVSGVGGVDNAMVRSDGTAGTAVQGSAVLVPDVSTGGTQDHQQIKVDDGATTNLSMLLTTKGTGALIVGPPPDGTVTGGNARGQYAVDLQITKFAADSVASGTGAFVAGQQCKASGNTTVAIGFKAIATGNVSNALGCYVTSSGNYGCLAVGYQSLAIGSSAFAFGSGGYAHHDTMMAHGCTGSDRRHQFFRDLLWGETSSTDAYKLSTNGSGKTSALRDQTSQWVTIAILGRQDDGSSGAAEYRCLIERTSTTTRLIGSVSTVVAWSGDAGLGTPSISITANDTNEELYVEVTPANATSTRWLCSVQGLEALY